MVLAADIYDSQDKTNFLIDDAVRSTDERKRGIESAAMDAIRSHAAKLWPSLHDAIAEIESPVADLERTPKPLVLMDFDDNCGEFARLHWETAVSSSNGAAGRNLLIRHDGAVIARFVDCDCEKELAKEGPAGIAQRLLLITSAYKRSGAFDQALDDEFLNIYKELDKRLDGRVKHLRNPNPREISLELKEPKYTMVHFLGHGGFDKGVRVVQHDGTPMGDAYIILRAGDGRRHGRKVYWSVLGEKYLTPDRLASVGMVTLMACSLDDRFRVGSALVSRYRVPAVITMTREASVEVAKRFTTILYAQMAGGEDVITSYGEALAELSDSSPVEGFVPCLTLGTLNPVRIIDPESRTAQEVREREANWQAREIFDLRWLAERIWSPVTVSMKSIMEFLGSRTLRKQRNPVLEELLGRLQAGEIAGPERIYQMIGPNLRPEERRVFRKEIRAARESARWLGNPLALFRVQQSLLPEAARGGRQLVTEREILLAKGYAFVGNGDWRQADEVCRRLRTRYPDFREAVQLHGQILKARILDASGRNAWAEVLEIAGAILQDRELPVDVSSIAPAWREEASEMRSISSSIRLLPAGSDDPKDSGDKLR